MEKPIVGVVDLGNDPFRRYMKGKYLSALKAVGAETVLLPWAETGSEAARALEGCGGLLLPGGADVDPALYGQEKGPRCGKPCPGRDRAEPLYFAEAVKRGIAVLGICRGCQLINVLLGGSLWQDIGDVGGAHPRHMDFFGRARATHTVTLSPASRLSGLHGAPTVGVNSMHHQALREVPPALRAAAVSEDGIVEALEGDQTPFLLAVQWHPEHLYRRDPFALEIFRRFAAAAASS